MKRTFPEWDQSHTIKVQPYPFARFIAKIGYGYAAAEYGLAGFHPFPPDIILGKSDDYFSIVGGNWELASPIPGPPHRLGIDLKIVAPNSALLIVTIRLLAPVLTPDYHVVVGEIDFEDAKHLGVFSKHRLEGKIKDGPLGFGEPTPGWRAGRV